MYSIYISLTIRLRNCQVHVVNKSSGHAAAIILDGEWLRCMHAAKGKALPTRTLFGLHKRAIVTKRECCSPDWLRLLCAQGLC